MNNYIYVDSITFSDGKTYQLNENDIIVFTGANNVGKTHTLIEISNAMKSIYTENHVIKDISFQKKGTSEDFINNCTLKKGYYRYSNLIFPPENVQYMKECWDTQVTDVFTPGFLNFISTEKRLSAGNPADITQMDLNYEEASSIFKIYQNDNLEKTISSYFKEAFGESLILNRVEGAVIPFYVGTPPLMKEGEDRMSVGYVERLQQLPRLETQGDGIRSFAGVLIDVFTGKQSITLIDEPEAFLHPPQAKLLGKILLNNIPEKKQLFISTHSEDFLKGLLEVENNNVKLFRINREQNINKLSLLDNIGIKTIWNDPLLRYSNILSGLFHSKVVLCEADTDCLFYQAMVNAIDYGEKNIKNDILYIHCGGKKRLKTVIKALKALDVKIVVIADIDILNNAEKDDTFEEVTKALGIDWNRLKTKREIILEYVASQRAQLDTSDVKKEINKILESVNSDFFPNHKAKEINAVVKKASAWSKIKEVGYRFFRGDAIKAYEEIDSICKSAGLYIVPVGELECFYKLNSDHGTKWVNAVLSSSNIDIKTDLHLEEARTFVKEIIKY